MINDDLLVRTLAQIEARPDLWDQLHWQCGSSYCFAGWAAVLSGATFIASSDFVTFETRTDSRHCSTAAKNALGLPYGYDAAAPGNLFWGTNTLDDLYRISAELMHVDEQVLRDKVRDYA